jgi:hypothetical protein
MTKFKSRAKNATQNVTLAHMHNKHHRSRATRFAYASAVKWLVSMWQSSHALVLAGQASSAFAS